VAQCPFISMNVPMLLVQGEWAPEILYEEYDEFRVRTPYKHVRFI
jgi:hypothetical protein